MDASTYRFSALSIYIYMYIYILTRSCFVVISVAGSSKVWGMMGLKFAFCTVWVVLKKKTVPELKKKKKKNSKVRTVHVLVIPRVA